MAGRTTLSGNLRGVDCDVWDVLTTAGGITQICIVLLRHGVRSTLALVSSPSVSAKWHSESMNK
jgi:hypothetical protein